jgi:hypothetical protein
VRKLAEVLVAMENDRPAVRLFAVVDRNRQTIGDVGVTDPIRPASIEAARARLGVAAFEVEWRLGSRMSLPQAIAYALEVTDG